MINVCKIKTNNLFKKKTNSLKEHEVTIKFKQINVCKMIMILQIWSENKSKNLIALQLTTDASYILSLCFV